MAKMTQDDHEAVAEEMAGVLADSGRFGPVGPVDAEMRSGGAMFEVVTDDGKVTVLVFSDGIR